MWKTDVWLPNRKGRRGGINEEFGINITHDYIENGLPS